MEQVIDKGKGAVSTAINGLATAAKSNAHVLVIVGVFLLLILLVMSGFFFLRHPVQRHNTGVRADHLHRRGQRY